MNEVFRSHSYESNISEVAYVASTPVMINLDQFKQVTQQGMKVLAKSFEALITLDVNQWHSIQPVWTNEY